MSGYVCSDTVFNLSHRVLSVTRVKVLEKCLDYALIQKKINEPELMAAFVNFAGVWEIRGFFGMNKLLNLVSYHVLKLDFRGKLLMAIQPSILN